VPDARLILYHKQATSARIRFLKLGYGGVCGFEPIPMPAALIEKGGGRSDDAGVVMHPATLVADAERRLGLEPGALEVDGGFREQVDVPGGPIEVFLAHFTTIDPPFDQVAEHGGVFIEFAEARGLPGVDLELMREVYEHAIG
jgi:hypothetical protein